MKVDLVKFKMKKTNDLFVLKTIKKSFNDQ